MAKIIGRKEEKAVLQEAFNTERSEFIALYGRRRVGKTFLIKNFFESKNCILIYVSGMKDGNLKEQLQNFTQSLERDLLKGLSLKPPSSWMEAFEMLNKLLERFDRNKKIVLFLDEVPWLSTKRSRFLQALDYYWNRFWSHDLRFKLVICGSAASWIIRNVIRNRGGLYNRVTRQMLLESFDLCETKEFLRSNKVKLNHRQILEIYMVTGGVPYYLNHIQAGLSATENISKMAFSKRGILYQDFDHLFESLFDDADQYREIIEIVSQNRYGIEQEEVIRKSRHLERGGGANRKIQDLEEAGLVITFVPYGHKKKGVYVRVIDEYIAFYLRWIDPVKKSAQKLIQARRNWLSQRNSPSWQAWSGYAFENICYKHTDQIHEALNLDPSAIPATWRHDGKLGKEGAQVDLLFDRTDGAVTLCEIKYTEQPFCIDKSYYQQLVRKIDVYKKVTKTQKEIFFAFIASSGLKKSIYSEELVSGLVVLEDLFKSH